MAAEQVLNNPIHDKGVKHDDADLEAYKDKDGRDSKGAVTSDSTSDIVGKQIELEAGNAIKYRTCSWQKVCG